MYKSGVVHAKEKKKVVMLVVTEDKYPTNRQLSALKGTKRNGLTIASQQKRNASGNDACVQGAVTSVAINWGIVAFEAESVEKALVGVEKASIFEF